MLDVLKNPMLFYCVKLIAYQQTNPVDMHRLVATIYRYHQLAESTDFAYEFKSDSFIYK
jgi:hypothetical protein